MDKRFWRQIRLKPFDGVVLVLAVGIIIAFSVLAVRQGGAPRAVEIRSDEGEFIYPLDEDRELHVHGPLGDSIIIIEDGTVRFVESPCRDKICISAGTLVHSGDWTACLPNRVFVTVAGTPTAENPVDATAF